MSTYSVRLTAHAHTRTEEEHPLSPFVYNMTRFKEARLAVS